MKKKKGLHKGWYVLGVVVVIGAIFMFGPKPSGNMMYDTEVVKSGNIETYYQFSGMIDAIDKQAVMLNTVAEIKSLDVSEGDLVKSGDRLLTTTQGVEVKATIDGEVTSLTASSGDVVTAGMAILNVVNFDKLKVDIKVDEFDISHVAVDDEVLVYVEAINKTVSGVITRVSKEAVFSNGVSYFNATVELVSDEA
ncbi:MAG TPA: RND transporter, partial [Firmicutes bacterium]|nr:RND transporter [Bacillota bacterium]